MVAWPAAESKRADIRFCHVHRNSADRIRSNSLECPTNCRNISLCIRTSRCPRTSYVPGSSWVRSHGMWPVRVPNANNADPSIPMQTSTGIRCSHNEGHLWCRCTTTRIHRGIVRLQIEIEIVNAGSATRATLLFSLPRPYE